MSILVNKNSKVLVQGITGSEGSFHTKQMLEYGTNIVAGVTPGKGGQSVFDNIPVFDTVEEAKVKTNANASIIFVPPKFAANAIIEAANQKISTIVCPCCPQKFFETKNSYSKHLLDSHKPSSHSTKCVFCGLNLPTWCDLLKHQGNCFPKLDFKSFNQCKDCDMGFFFSQEENVFYFAHMNKEHCEKISVHVLLLMITCQQ